MNVIYEFANGLQTILTDTRGRSKIILMATVLNIGCEYLELFPGVYCNQ
jgi:hypothetical protein